MDFVFALGFALGFAHDIDLDALLYSARYKITKGITATPCSDINQCSIFKSSNKNHF
jgi:hypothetical protein